MESSSQIPKVMKGVLVERTGGVEELQYKTDLPVPIPKEGEVLVKNEFIGVNYIDTYFRTGLYTYALPLIHGREAEGQIISLGPTSSSSSTTYYNLQPSQRVWYHTSPNLGCYAEHTTVPSEKVVALPYSLSPGTACASVFQGLTALTLIREAHPVQRGEWILVHAAAGGVGLWFCQLLRVLGARTIGTAGTEEKCALARENGAEFCINYREETGKKLVRKVMDITEGKGVHVVYDSVGKDMFELDLEVARRGGMVVSYGNASGAVPPFSIARLSPKCLKVCRPTWTNYIETREQLVAYAEEFLDLLTKHNLHVQVHKTYPLTEAQQGHRDIESRKTTGKLLLKP